MEELYEKFESFLFANAVLNADATAKQMHMKDPLGELANVAMARVLMSQGKNAQAVQQLVKLGAPLIKMPVALAYLGEAYWAVQEDAKAEECAQKSMSLRPGNLSASSLMGKILVKQGKYDEAVVCLSRITQAGAAEPVDWHQLSMALRKTKRYDAAVQALLHVAASKPADVNVSMELIQTRMENGEAERALTDLQALVTKNPRNPDLLKFAGEIRKLGTTTSNPLAGEIAVVRDLLVSGKIKEAEAKLQMLLKYHRPTRALKFVIEELALARPGANLGEVQVRVNELAKQYKEAWEPRALLADLLLRGGSTAQAMTAIPYAEQAWSVSGGHPRAGLLLVRAYKLGGKAQFAKALSGQLVALSPAMKEQLDKAMA